MPALQSPVVGIADAGLNSKDVPESPMPATTVAHPRKRCSLSFSDRVPLPVEDRSTIAARLRHHIRFCPFANLLLAGSCAVGSPGGTGPTPVFSLAGSTTLARRRLTAT